MADFVMLPGIGGSGTEHWQSHWEKRLPKARRFQPTSWDKPELADWMAALDRAVAEAYEPPLLIAHSLACLLVAHWQRASCRDVAGAFLVAVPDPKSPAFPRRAAGFVDAPLEPLRFKSLIIASSNDPFAEIEYARRRAAQWRSGVIDVGAQGHINGQNGPGSWPIGSALLHAFAAGLGCFRLVENAFGALDEPRHGKVFEMD
jgi:predicted alpha/beta hydrolase family esterase